MKPRKLPWIGAAAVVWFGGSALLAQPALTVYGPIRRTNLAFNRPENRSLFAVINSPSAGVFGAVANVGPRRVGGLVPDSRAAGLTIGVAEAANAGANSTRTDDRAAVARPLSASAALQMTRTIHAISLAPLPAREGLISEVAARLDASESALVALNTRARTFRGEDRAEFKAALKDVHAQARALQRSLRAANQAQAQDWGKARAELAAHYGAYAEAVAHAEAVVSWADAASPAAARPDRDPPLVNAEGDARDRVAAGADW